ncbi:MAG: 8-oxo-dGTP diphosphatase MutT [Firmicutes bacterium]|nr:8-oxo-dGTP diphosphatase MutT [Bacillota bacterium]
MKTIKVAAAVIMSENEQGEKVIFATERGYGDYKDWWEFPGGKLEAGETPEEALVREIREELNIRIDVDQFLLTVEHDYPAFHLSMDCFLCQMQEGHMTLLEHEDARWLKASELRSVRWLPADVKVVEMIKKML